MLLGDLPWETEIRKRGRHTAQTSTGADRSFPRQGCKPGVVRHIKVPDSLSELIALLSFQEQSRNCVTTYLFLWCLLCFFLPWSWSIAGSSQSVFILVSVVDWAKSVIRVSNFVLLFL